MVVPFSMAYRSFWGGSGRLDTHLDTPPSINRRHPVSCLAHVLSNDGPGPLGSATVKEEHPAHGRQGPCADRPSAKLARDHKAGRRTEPRGSRVGQLLQCRLVRPSLSRARYLHTRAAAPVVAVQTQGQATPRRDVSTLAPLRALRARTSAPAWARPVVGEGVRSCPRAQCGKSACCVR